MRKTNHSMKARINRGIGQNNRWMKYHATRAFLLLPFVLIAMPFQWYRSWKDWNEDYKSAKRLSSTGNIYGLMKPEAWELYSSNVLLDHLYKVYKATDDDLANVAMDRMPKQYSEADNYVDDLIKYIANNHDYDEVSRIIEANVEKTKDNDNSYLWQNIKSMYELYG